MKDEIKEILQLIGNCCYYGKISEDKCEKYCNCITNLQEKYNEYKNLYFSEHKVKEDYKQRNEKAIEYIIKNSEMYDEDLCTDVNFELVDLLKILGGKNE